MSTTVRALRLQLINLPAAVAWQWGILAIAFVINLIIFAPLSEQARDDFTTGGLAALYVTALVGWIQVATQVFPFALGFSVSRSRFLRATLLLMAVEALITGAALTGLLHLERATDGWGVGLTFFGLPFVPEDGVALQVLAYAVPYLALALGGVWCGLISVRWGTNGLLALGAGALVAGGVLVAIATWGQHWPSIGSWFTSQSEAALLAGWPLLLVVALVLVNHSTIRRAAP